MTELDQLERRVVATERAVERSAGEARSVAQEGKRVQAEIAELQQVAEHCETAMGVISRYADARQRDLESKVEAIVTYGLREIFGEDMSFHIRQTQHGKLAATDLMVRSKLNGSYVDTSVMDARGGGVAAVIGFLLRTVLLLMTPNAQRVLFLDETFAQLSSEYEQALAEFIRELVDKSGIQVLLVTHSNAYAEYADKAYRFDLMNGTTKVESL